MSEPAVWVLTAVLALAGTAGVFLPLLPGPPLILAAAVFAKVMLPAALSWWTVGGLAVLALAAEGVQLALTLGGARRLGATKWGMGGAAVGAVLGLWGGLLGMFVGAAAGALVAEAAFAGRDLQAASKAALGAALGLAASMAGRAALAFLMLAWLAADAIL